MVSSKKVTKKPKAAKARTPALARTKPKPKRKSKWDNRPGLFWHYHHAILFEWAYDPDYRRKALSFKPHSRIRRARFNRIKGKLGDQKVYARALDKKVGPWVYLQTISTKDATELHKKECKRCPWNGFTLFPPKKKKH